MCAFVYRQDGCVGDVLIVVNAALKVVGMRLAIFVQGIGGSKLRFEMRERRKELLHLVLMEHSMHKVLGFATGVQDLVDTNLFAYVGNLVAQRRARTNSEGLERKG